MSLLYSLGDKKYKYPYPHDPNDARYYHFVWGAPLRSSSLEYIEDDVVAPLTPNGFYYRCSKPGVSDATEPTMGSSAGGPTTDGTVTWEAIPYDLLLRRGESFTSSWVSSTAGVLLDEDSSDTYRSWVRVYEVPTDVTAFEITNSIVVTRSDGRIEKYDRTLVIKVKDM